MDVSRTTETMNVLEERLERMERCIFGDEYDGRSAVNSFSSSSDDTIGDSKPEILTTHADITTRVNKLKVDIPSPPGFDKVYQHYKSLGLTSEHDLKRLLATPLDMSHKSEIIVANASHLRRLSLTAETILRLKDYVGGDAWYCAREERPRLAQAEVSAVDLLTTSSALSHRMDASLEHYDTVVGIVSEKMSAAVVHLS
jgi:hypothetical protein